MLSTVLRRIDQSEKIELYRNIYSENTEEMKDRNTNHVGMTQKVAEARIRTFSGPLRSLFDSLHLRLLQGLSSY